MLRLMHACGRCKSERAMPLALQMALATGHLRHPSSWNVCTKCALWCIGIQENGMHDTAFPA